MSSYKQNNGCGGRATYSIPTQGPLVIALVVPFPHLGPGDPVLYTQMCTLFVTRSVVRGVSRDIAIPCSTSAEGHCHGAHPVMRPLVQLVSVGATDHASWIPAMGCVAGFSAVSDYLGAGGARVADKAGRYTTASFESGCRKAGSCALLL